MTGQGPFNSISGLAERSLARSPETLRWLGRFSRLLPQWIYTRGAQSVVDILCSGAALALAYNLRFDFVVGETFLPALWLWCSVVAIVRPAIMYSLGAHRIIWRYFNLRDAVVLMFTEVPATVLLLLVRTIWGNRTYFAGIPYTVIIIDFGLFLTMAAGFRALRRTMYEGAASHQAKTLSAVLVGSEETLVGAIRQVSADPQIQVHGILVPGEHLKGLRIGGQQVLATPSELAQVLSKGKVDLVLIADARLAAVGDVVATATEYGVDVRLLPSSGNVLRGEVRVASPPRVEEVVSGKSAPGPEEMAPVFDHYRGKTVLVTGAGGSIGSEICRQVLQLSAGSLLLFDQDENSIFELNNELKAQQRPVRLVPLVGDVRDETRVQHVFSKYRPQIVLHAAAYKHVPVMEQNGSEAVLNNIGGTRILADAASEYSVDSFLMISTDKAVHPTSMMGGSKRIAEVLVQARAKRGRAQGSKTQFACVRFGNVAGSRGSVVPIFLRQIANGEPLTLTDEQMTRYFMTIPEAVQLVLRASVLESNGDIYMLDMGDPVRIRDLAQKLITMSGLRPGKDVEIQIVGARPGEKMHEELFSKSARIEPTRFEKIFCVMNDPVEEGFESKLSELLQTASLRLDEEVQRQLFSLLASLPEKKPGAVPPVRDKAKPNQGS